MRDTTIARMIETFPDKPWNWHRVSRNPGITVHFVNNYPDFPWDWIGLSSNPNITLEYIESHPEKAWNWFEILKYKNVSLEFIKRVVNKYELNIDDIRFCLMISFINGHFNLTDVEIKEMIRLGWMEGIYEHLSFHTNLTQEIVETYMDKPWDWSAFRFNQQPFTSSKHKSKEQIFYDFNKSNASGNRTINEDLIDRHPDYDWNWDTLSSNPNLTPSFIEKHIHKNWNWDTLSYNRNITPEFVKRHESKPWNWDKLSSNSFKNGKGSTKEEKVKWAVWVHSAFCTKTWSFTHLREILV